MADQLVIAVPKEYGYVILTASATFLLNAWHGLLVGRYRNRAGVKYPNHYAPAVSSSATSLNTAEEKAAADKNAYLFNCMQRAHGNYLENQPTMLAAMLITGLTHPIIASALGVGWCVNRVIYALGYVAENEVDGRGRLRGVMWEACHLGLIGTSIWTGVSLARAQI